MALSLEGDLTSDLRHVSSDLRQVLASHEVTVYSDGSEGTFRAMFQEPLEVEPAVQYIASVTLKVRQSVLRQPLYLDRIPRQGTAAVCPGPALYCLTDTGAVYGLNPSCRLRSVPNSWIKLVDIYHITLRKRAKWVSALLSED